MVIRLKDFFLCCFIYALAAVCLGIFVITKSAYLMDRATLSNSAFGTRYGDLYTHVRASFFKEPMIHGPVPKDYETDLTNADVLFVGDSYFNVEYGQYSFPYKFAKKNNARIFSAVHPVDYKNPLAVLEEAGYQKQQKTKILVLETIEHKSIERFARAFVPDEKKKEEKQNSGTVFENRASLIRKRWFTETEKNYYFFMHNNRFTAGFTPINDLEFLLFKNLPPVTPRFSMDPPMLFYDKAVNHFTAAHTDEQIELLAAHLRSLSEYLKERYAIVLVFMPVPNKYTIYHPFVKNNRDRYDDFLPRLYAALEKQGVRHVRLYDVFRNHPKTELLYWGSDIHWNNRGMDIALAELEKVLEKIYESF